jgi:hypothetical protein
MYVHSNTFIFLFWLAVLHVMYINDLKEGEDSFASATCVLTTINMYQPQNWHLLTVPTHYQSVDSLYKTLPFTSLCKYCNYNKIYSFELFVFSHKSYTWRVMYHFTCCYVLSCVLVVTSGSVFIKCLSVGVLIYIVMRWLTRVKKTCRQTL